MAKRRNKEFLEIKKGYPFYCEKCNKFLRYGKLIPKTTEFYIALTCPNCGEMVEERR